MPPLVDITAASISKQGHRPEENEDAWAISQADHAMFAAVSDGATESVYAREWANALSRSFIDPEPWRSWLEAKTVIPGTFHERTDHARAAWKESVDASMEAVQDDVPWYVIEKREQGAFATVLGLALFFPVDDEHGSGRILAASIGDCGLFRVDAQTPGADRLSAEWAWPHDDPDVFTHRPELVSSRQSAAGSGAQMQFLEDEWAPGDVFVLGTDAVAAWLLREKPLLPTADADAKAWLQGAQADGRLRNDDSTLVILRTSAR